jgi:RNA polymerase sigma-70 factor, ECF subfamily
MGEVVPLSSRQDDRDRSGSALERPDEQLLRALHDTHGRALWAYALRLTGGDVGRAQDAVQEALLRAWRHPDVLDPARGSARAWLYTTVRNVLIDDWRARQVRPEVVTDEVPEMSSPDHAEAAVQSWLVADALRQLSPAHRDVIVECFYRGHTVTEAADRLGIPAGTVKSRTYYALRALRLVLEERGVTA